MTTMPPPSAWGAADQPGIVENGAEARGPRLRVHGPAKLRGTVSVGGAKNAALPIMAAALLTGESCILRNVPRIDDVETLADVLRALGAIVEFPDPHTAVVTADGITSTCAPADLVRKMRASFLVIGPLLARFGSAATAQPGGCEIGIRPVDVHLEGFRDLGAEMSPDAESYRVKGRRLRGVDLFLDYPSHTGTENLIMAACLAEGQTIIRNACIEPEVVDLVRFLEKMGAHIEGAGSHTITVQGVTALRGCEHEIMPDRLIAGTYLAGAAITRGDVTVEKIIPEHLDAATHKLRKMGARVDATRSTLRCSWETPLRAVDIQAIPYPGFPTDLQAVFGALLTQAQGMSTIVERVFEDRLGYVQELKRMGARIRVDGQKAWVYGPTRLHGASVRALDVRAGAATILTSLVADGETIVEDAHHISRGYEDLVEGLQSLGGDISWVQPIEAI